VSRSTKGPPPSISEAARARGEEVLGDQLLAVIIPASAVQ
jgi:hypothetical protein